MSSNSTKKYNSNDKFSYKALSIIHSSFKNILFIDSDNFIIQHPKILFESKIFKEYKAIFWPDLWNYKCKETCMADWCMVLYQSTIKEIYDTFTFMDDIPYNASEYKFLNSMESGQLLIDSQYYMNELHMTYDCTIKQGYDGNDTRRNPLHGDKDCFRLMWIKNSFNYNQPKYSNFYFIPIQPKYLGYMVDNASFSRHMVLQYWIDNTLLFMHQPRYVDPIDYIMFESYVDYIEINPLKFECPSPDYIWLIKSSEYINKFKVINVDDPQWYINIQHRMLEYRNHTMDDYLYDD